MLSPTYDHAQANSTVCGGEYEGTVLYCTLLYSTVLYIHNNRRRRLLHLGGRSLESHQVRRPLPAEEQSRPSLDLEPGTQCLLLLGL